MRASACLRLSRPLSDDLSSLRTALTPTEGRIEAASRNRHLSSLGARTDGPASATYSPTQMYDVFPLLAGSSSITLALAMTTFTPFRSIPI